MELVGALAEIKKGIFTKDYPNLDIRLAQIHILQSSDCILKGMSEQASKKAEDFLEKLGVNIWKNVRVTGYDGKTVTTNTDLTFETATVVWAAGVKGATIKGVDAEDFITRGNRILVNEFNQVKVYSHIFAVGDIACMASKEFPDGFPMMAQPAIQQGKQLGDNLLRLIEGKLIQSFVYKYKGAVATIGRNKAVED